MQIKSLEMKLLLLVGVLIVIVFYQTEALKCNMPIDIVFAMDSSRSMTTRDFFKQKRFVQSLSRKFTISNRGAHAGVIAYSTSASIAIGLNKHRTWSSFARAVWHIRFERGDTRIDLALKKAQEIFSKSRGGRTGLPKVLIVLTDGQQSLVFGEEPQLDRAVLPLRKQGIKVFVIGIGRSISKRQLRLLVEKPSDLLISRSFYTLRRHIDSITSKLCAGALPPAFGIYPFNARYRGREISENRGPRARFSRISRSWGPQGQPGGALYLRGTQSSFIEIPNRPRGKLDTRTSTSIFLWVRLSRLPGPIVNYRRNGNGVGLFYYGRGTISANFIGRMGYFRRRLIYRGVSVGRWHFIGLTYNHITGYGRLWIHDRPVRSMRVGRVILATQYPIRLGSVDHIRRHFQGRVTCLQIYNADLNVDQVYAIKKRCSSPQGAIDPCQNRPCYNGGSCIKTPKSGAGFRCRCRSGYYGKLCQKSIGRPTMKPTRKPTRGPSGPSGIRTGPSRSVSTRPTRKPGYPGSPIKNTDIFRIQILEYINVFRRIHGVGPVIISDDINPKAQKWATHISSLGTEKTDPSSPYGKTICLRRGTLENLAKECVFEWYETVKNYNWHDRSISTASMNFVQMIWKSSLRVGVGVVRGGRGRFYVVVYYDEPGNKVNQMEENVPGFTDVYLMVYGASCQKGYAEYQGSCYKYHSKKVTWDDAVRSTIAENATLLSLHDLREVDFLGSVPVKDKDDIIWTGLNNRLKRGSYMNTDGSGIEYVDWKAGEPDGDKERCVAVSTRQTFYRYGTMFDQRCSEKHQFVAKKSLEGIVTYQLTIDVLSLVWVDDLYIPGTLAFLQLKTKFEDAILKIYAGETNLVTAMIERFSPLKPTPSKKKPGATKKPSKRPSSRIPTSRSPNQVTPTNGWSGRPTGSRSNQKVTASIILKFIQKVKPDPTLPFQEALKKNKGKLPAPVNERVVIKKIRIVKPGEDNAHIGSCNPYCAYKCMSTCNPLCCSSRIATNAINPMMANIIQQRQMALMQRHNGYSPRMGMYQGGRPCVPSPMNRCLPNNMQGQIRMPMNYGMMQRPVYQGSQGPLQAQRLQNQGCAPGARMPCPSGRGMQMPMQRPFNPMQNPMLQRMMGQGCVPTASVPCPSRKGMHKPMGSIPMRNPMMQRPLPMPNPVIQRPLPMPNPVIQRPLPMPNPMMQRPLPMPNPMMQRPLPMPNPVIQRPLPMPNPMMQRPLPMPNPMLQRPFPMPNPMIQRPSQMQNPMVQRPIGLHPIQTPMMQRPYPMLNPNMQRPMGLHPLQKPVIHRQFPMPNPMMQRPMGQPCTPSSGMPCPRMPQMQMNPFMQGNPYLQGLQMWRQKQLMQRQSKNKKVSKKTAPQVGCVSRPGFMCPPNGPMSFPGTPAYSMPRPMGSLMSFGPQRPPFMTQQQFPLQVPRRPQMAKSFVKVKTGKPAKPINILGAPLPSIYRIIYPPQFSFPMTPRCIPTPSKPCTKTGKSRSVHPVPKTQQMPFNAMMQQDPYQGTLMNNALFMPYSQPLSGQFPLNKQAPIQSPLMPQQQPIVVQAADLPKLLYKADNPMMQSTILALLQPRPMYPFPQQNLGKKNGKTGKAKKKGKEIRKGKAKKGKTIEMTGAPLPTIHIVGYPLQPPLGYQPMPMPMQRPMPMPMQRPMPMHMQRPMPMPMQRPMPMPMQRPMPMPMHRPMPMPMQRPMPMPMQRPMPMPMHRPMPMPMQRPMPMPMQRPMPMPMQRPMPMPMQRPMPMPMHRPMPMPMQRPMPMPMQRPMPMPMQRPMPMPMQRPMPMPMPMQRPMPMPMQRPMSMPMHRPMPMPMPMPRPIPMQMPMQMQGQMPFQFPQPCVPTASKRCPPKNKIKAKKAINKPKMLHFLGAPIPGPPPMTYILPPPPPRPMTPMMSQPCIPRPLAPCPPLGKIPGMPVPMQQFRPMAMPMAMPMGVPMQQSLPMPRAMPMKTKLKKKPKSKQKPIQRKQPLTNFGPMQNPMAPMPGNPCIPTLFNSCPPLGKPIPIVPPPPNPFMSMPYRHPFAKLNPITHKRVPPLEVRLPNIVLKYPVNKQSLPNLVVKKVKPKMPMQNRLSGTMPYGMQMPMQYPMPMGMPNFPRPGNPFSPFVNPNSCPSSCIKPKGVFCPSYCPSSCCRSRNVLNGKKRSKIAKPNKH